jgi:hypothetical protein
MSHALGQMIATKCACLAPVASMNTMTPRMMSLTLFDVLNVDWSISTHARKLLSCENQYNE